MRGTLDFRRLRYFLAVADAGSMSSAARTLNLAQPAVSYHIAEFERVLGRELFTRGRDGVQLTEGGRLLERHARDILGRVEAAELAMESLDARRRSPVERVRVAIISSLATGLTPVLLGHVERSLPDVALRIIEAGTRDIEHRLKRGEADIAVYLAGNVDAGGTLLGTEQLYFVSARTGARERSTITLAELAAERLILPASGNPLRDFLDATAAGRGLQFDVVLEVDGVRPRLNATLKRVGGTVIGAQAITGGDLDDGLSARRIVSPRLRRPIYLGARRDFDPGLRDRMKDLISASLLELGLSPPRGS